MDHRERVIRDNVIIDLSIALRIRAKLNLQAYARIPRTRRGIDGVEKMEAWAIENMTAVLAPSFSPFALVHDGGVEHWQASRPCVHRTLASVPIDIRAAMVRRGSDSSGEIADQVFHAVDTEFRLVPLSASPGLHGTPTWGEIFQREYGEQQPMLR